MELYFIIVLFIFGTIFGSFFNVVGSRLPKDESIVNPPSHCTACGHQLAWYELIPIFSFLMQGAKCRNCKIKLSWFHPLYEFTTGLLFALSCYIFGMTPELIIALTFISILMILVVSDYYYMIIPDQVLIVGCLMIGLEILIINGLTPFITSLFNGLIAFGVMYLIKIIGDVIFKKESMGGGDIKLLFLFGMLLGIPLSIISIFLASFIALPISLIILYKNETNIIPFGPFLSVSAIIIFLSQIDIELILKVLSNG